MAISTDSLLALKAYHLGRGIAERTARRDDALKMIDAAISQLETSSDETSLVRLLFYVLLKAEALRSNAEVVALRSRAKSIAERVGSQSFDLFMNIEALTHSVSQIKGFQVGVIVDPGIKGSTLRGYEVQGPTSNFAVVEDDACLAVGVERMSMLSWKQRYFVYEMPLKEILNHHGIRSAP